jgi:hypothetical protein
MFLEYIEFTYIALTPLNIMYAGGGRKKERRQGTIVFYYIYHAAYYNMR